MSPGSQPAGFLISVLRRDTRRRCKQNNNEPMTLTVRQSDRASLGGPLLSVKSLDKAMQVAVEM